MTNLRTLLTETANLVADYRDAVSDHRVAPEIDWSGSATTSARSG